MKRYEKMTPEMIVNTLRSSLDDGCGVNSIRMWCEHLCEGVTPRIATLNTIEDLKKAFKDFNNHCDGTRCSVCKYNTKGENGGLEGCFLGFLEEEV